MKPHKLWLIVTIYNIKCRNKLLYRNLPAINIDEKLEVYFRKMYFSNNKTIKQTDREYFCFQGIDMTIVYSSIVFKLCKCIFNVPIINLINIGK